MATQDQAMPREAVLRPRLQGRRLFQGLRGVYSTLLLLLLWEAAALVVHNQLFLPTPVAVGEQTVSMLLAGKLLPDVWASSYRALVGFSLAAVVGVAIGIAMARSSFWERFCNPLVSLTYPIPKIGLIPLFILWLGLGETSKIAIVFTAAIYPAIVNTYTGIKGTPKVLGWRGQTLGASRREILLRIVLPHALPHILDGLRLAMGLSWILVFAAEMVSARSGLGFLILQAEQFFETPVVFTSLVSIAVLGFLFDRIILGIAHRACDWYYRQAGEDLF